MEGIMHMNIFIFSDESGVFDVKHNDLFVFGGVILLSKEDKELLSRKYTSAEKRVRDKMEYSKQQEIKASLVSNGDKLDLYKALNDCYKFGVVIKQKEVNHNIFNDKKSKQRYLDYAYKIGIKRALQSLIKQGIIRVEEVENIYFFVDEHSTATNGRYELKESLEREFKYGTFNGTWSKYYPPLFPKAKVIDLKFCNSASILLVRAADIVANRIFYLERQNAPRLSCDASLHITYLT